MAKTPKTPKPPKLLKVKLVKAHVRGSKVIGPYFKGLQ